MEREKECACVRGVCVACMCMCTYLCVCVRVCEASKTTVHHPKCRSQWEVQQEVGTLKMSVGSFLSSSLSLSLSPPFFSLFLLSFLSPFCLSSVFACFSFHLLSFNFSIHLSHSLSSSLSPSRFLSNYFTFLLPFFPHYFRRETGSSVMSELSSSCL